MAITPRDKKRIRQLHALLGSQNDHECENARTRLNELLQKLRLTWNDLPEILAPANDSADTSGNSGGADDDPPVGTQNALELVHYMLQQFVDLKPFEYVAVALWIMHTFVFDRFLISPRLGLLSPVRGCGKTTLLALLESLTARPLRTDGISPAAIYHMVDAERRSLLIDEADNADLGHNGMLRAVLNSGHRKGGGITRLIDGEPKRYATFAPVAIAAIGTLPLPIVARSVVIPMQRSDRSKSLRRLDDVHANVDLDLAYRHTFMWARTAQLDLEPEMPAGLRNRAADNWRALISIADSFGPFWGAAARDAAVTLAGENSDEDAGVMLLIDVRGIFGECGADRITSAELVRRLVDLEDSSWGEPPRALTQGRMSVMLKPFRIKPKTIWPRGHRDGESKKGYLRSQFESAWARYCPEAVTPSQSSKVRHLRKP